MQKEKGRTVCSLLQKKSVRLVKLVNSAYAQMRKCGAAF